MPRKKEPTIITVPRWNRVWENGVGEYRQVGTLELTCFESNGSFAITETKDGGPKYVVTHLATGTKIRAYSKIKSARELIRRAMVDYSGTFDWNVLDTYPKLAQYFDTFKHIVQDLYNEGYM